LEKALTSWAGRTLVKWRVFLYFHAQNTIIMGVRPTKGAQRNFWGYLQDNGWNYGKSFVDFVAA